MYIQIILFMVEKRWKKFYFDLLKYLTKTQKIFL